VSRHERWEQRDRGFSNWHRYACGDDSTAIDIDMLEYCERCRTPLLLVEAARDVPREIPKATIVVQVAAEAMKVRAVLALWTPSPTWQEEPPHCPCQKAKELIPGCDHGIERVRWRMIAADVNPRTAVYEECTGVEFAARIDRIHRRHACPPRDLS
jgi:hypothetical protein